MKLSLTLSLLLGMATLFQGCGTTEDAPDQDAAKSVTISGSTTLKSSRFNPAIVCLDSNDDGQCNEDEPQTSTDDLGAYSFTLPSEVADGTILMTSGGYSLILLDENNNSLPNTLEMYKYYKSEEGKQNINMYSTRVVEDLENSHDYEDSMANIADRYDLDLAMLLDDPIKKGLESRELLNFDKDADKKFFDYALALEIKEHNASTTHSTPSSMRAASADATSETDELDAILDEYSSIFDEYLDLLAQWWDSLFEDDEEEVIVDPPVVVDPPVEQPKLVDIQRNHLNGIWYIIDASGDKTCSDIRSNNDIAVTEADGKTTDLTLTYNNSKKTMLLKLGFFTADTIKFDKYYESSTEKTFTGNYQSDGETLKGYKMDTLANCKSSKLGL